MAVFASSVAVFLLALVLSVFPYNLKRASAEAPSLAVEPAGYTNIDNFTFTLTGDPIVGAAKYQYRTGGDAPSVWFDYSPAISTTITLGISNPSHPSGAYTEGENIFYFQALDGSDVVIPGSELEKKYYYNVTTPSEPTNLTVMPDTNTTNNFTFSWDAPGFYYGNPENISYYYSVNALPSEFNTTLVSSTSVGPSSFATQPGYNMFYVTAKDEAGNIDYSVYAMQAFIANTTAPGIPTNVTIDDISDKDTGQYRIVASWTPPTLTDPGNFAGYDVYSATSEGGPFTKIATTQDSAYVNTGLVQNSTHYYYVKATDKTQNASAQSSIVSATADGHYTVPPNITKEPTATAKSKTASINWGTSREANSYVEFGKTNALGSSTGNGATNYATDHTVTLTNLESNTLYYYKATFTDPDGNVGQSALKTFTTTPASTISNLKISNVGPSSATVTFDTNTPSRGFVEYGETTGYGSKTQEGTDTLTKHTITLSSLKSDTTYNLRVSQTDGENNTFVSDNYTTKTLPKPTVLNFGAEAKKNVNTPTIAVTYQTNVETTTVIRYKEKDKETKDYVLLEFETEHNVDLSNLTPLVEYELTITGEDNFGNEITPITETVTTLSDTLPPQVTSLVEKKNVIGEGTNAVAEITLKFTTSEPSKAVIEATQGISNKNFDIVSSEDNLALEHTITLKLGKAGLPYTYRIKLTDENNNQSLTKEAAIVAPIASEGVLEFVSGVFSKMFGWLSKYIKI